VRALELEFKEAMELCMLKNKDYGNAKEVAGAVMNLLFPRGIKIETPDQFNEFNMFVMIMSKVVRFANLSQSKEMPNFESIDDTLKDLGNYAFILKNMIFNNRLKITEGPVCTCGHHEVDHTQLEDGQVVCALHECGCIKFTKAGA
jgi:hypothetical protein